MWRRTTLADSLIISGTGLQTGRPGRVKISPGRDGIRIGRPGHLAGLCLQRVRAVPGGTVLQDGPATIEHLLAALLATGLTDVDVTVSGPEVPALDGSAARWIHQIHNIGLVDNPGTVPQWKVKHRVECTLGGGTAILESGDGTEVRVTVDFGPKRSGSAVAQLPGVGTWCEARTFICAEDEARLRASGRGLGATAQNTIRWSSNDQADLRVPMEPVAHKLLDAVGDLTCLGRPLLGTFIVHRGSHRLHLACLRQAMDQGALTLVDGQ